MALAIELAKWDNPIFRSYVYWTGILCLKMLAMSALTGLTRFARMTFANPEDAIFSKAKVKYDDQRIERFRRAHRNDMENIFVFFPIGFLYVLINPSAFLAISLFRIIGIGRIIHTVVYAIFVTPQPSRLLAWIFPYLATGFITLQVILYAA
ncbi:microsomal glutathione S-transferase 1-like [Eupeodes corollae]|uniref:microsomal glutathione S-transferase 1-like n=1 Tax=Eupeodes corollae TaxID=290404 RepID=UPI002491A344|nr:microsomal glutathione S-transferase 1-like [Eupeodes corollae]